jgi:hypothetical protein
LTQLRRFSGKSGAKTKDAAKRSPGEHFAALQEK